MRDAPDPRRYDREWMDRFLTTRTGETVSVAIGRPNPADGRVRMSAVAVCQRKAVLDSLEDEQPVTDARKRGHFARGEIAQEMHLQMLRGLFGPNVESEVPIPSPAPEQIRDGHADHGLLAAGVLWEVKSTSWTDDLPRLADVRQLGHYVALHPDVGTGWLVYLAAAHFGVVEAYPVGPAADAASVSQRVADARKAESVVKLPLLDPDKEPCVRRWGNTADWCPHHQDCHGAAIGGIPALNAEESPVREAVERWAEAQGRVKSLGALADDAKATIDQAKTELRRLAPGRYRTDGWDWSWSERAGGETFAIKDLRAAIAAGAVSEERAAPFVRTRRSSEHWRSPRRLDDDD